MTGLRDELRAIEADWPGFHCWLSDEGVMYATTIRYAIDRNYGLTVSAGSLLALRREIATTVWVHQRETVNHVLEGATR